MNEKEEINQLSAVSPSTTRLGWMKGNNNNPLTQIQQWS